jgi:hypothetical protein
MKKKIYLLIVMGIVLIGGQNAFGQAPPERIIGYRLNTYDTVLMQMSMADSTTWTYSEGRGDTGINNNVYDTWTWVNTTGRYALLLNQFDSHNNVVQTNLKLWSNNAWNNFATETDTYNADNYLTSQVIQNDSNAANNSQTLITYDAHNDTLTYIQNSEDSTGSWVLLSETQYAYDSLYRHTIVEVENVAGGVITGVTSARHYSYDSVGNVTAELFEQYSSGSLAPSGETDYTWDSGHVLLYADDYNFPNGTKTLYDEWAYFYNDPALKVDIEIYSTLQQGFLEPVFRYYYKYDSTWSFVDTITVQLNNITASTWNNYNQTIYTYNTAGRITETLYQVGDTSGNWHFKSSVTNQYDSANNVTYSQNMTSQNGTPVPATEGYYYYQVKDSAVAAIAQVIDAHTTVYPNPAHDILNVELTPDSYTALALYNTQGQEILNQIIAGTAAKISIGTSQLSPGIYLLQLQGENASATQKIVIQ